MTYFVLIQFCILSTVHDKLTAFGATITGELFIKNIISTANVILTETNISLTMCIMNCLINNQCAAVNFIRDERKCEQLNDISSINTLQNKDCCDYTKMTSWQMVCY